MKRRVTIPLLALAFIAGPMLLDSALQAQNNITFRVNMSIQAREGKFNIGTDIVRVAGSFNDWGNSKDTLKKGATDSIYSKAISLPTGAIQYKFLKTLRGGSDWEGGDNKQYTVVAGAQTLPVVWFDNDSVFTPAANVPVTFRVNMRVKMLEGGFRPDLNDIVRVAGSINDWGNSKDTLKKGATDSIYSKTVTLLEGTNVQYKYLKTLRGGLDWEGGDNKAYTVPIGGGTVPLGFFDNDSVVNTPIQGNILYRVDMSAYNTLGWFRRTQGDSMQVRGAFNSWGGTRMTRVAGSEVYEAFIPYDGFTFDDIDYKFYMKLDSAGAVARFPGWNTDRDGVNYEHPAERGDGNRKFNLGTGGNLQTPQIFFSSIHPNGIIKAGDTVTVTFRYDMRPAMTYIDKFVRGVDTAKVVWFDRAQRFAQGNPPDIILRDDGTSGDAVANDSIYSGRLTIRGPAHYNLMYYMTYVHGGAQTGSVSEGGGLGVQKPFRSRFIQPLGTQTFPRNYTMPIDVWQKSPPMPGETPPFAVATSVYVDEHLGPPMIYELAQNYPNPFNPSTRIRYTLPQQAKVKLSIYNLLGQKIATLVDEVQVAGNYVALFEGQHIPTGVYFYQLEAGNFREVKKMLLLK